MIPDVHKIECERVLNQRNIGNVLECVILVLNVNQNRIRRRIYDHKKGSQDQDFQKPKFILGK